MRPVGDGDGYFPCGDSVLRRVHGARGVGVLYRQRAPSADDYDLVTRTERERLRRAAA